MRLSPEQLAKRNATRARNELKRMRAHRIEMMFAIAHNVGLAEARAMMARLTERAAEQALRAQQEGSQTPISTVEDTAARPGFWWMRD
jgi:hypothetical protein